MKQRTKNVIDGAFVLAATLVVLFLSVNAWAGTAFYTGERISGMNKLCYYDYLGSEFVLTLKSYQLCPVTVTVPD